MAYTTIDDPTAHFQTTLFTGNANTVVTVTNSGNSDLSPDLLWFKKRDTAVFAFIDRNSAGIFVVAILFFLYLAVAGIPVDVTTGFSANAK